MSVIYRLLSVILAFLLLNPAQGIPLLDEVLADFRKTLPPSPTRRVSHNETALEATRFILQFLKEGESVPLRRSLKTIDTSSSIDSLYEHAFFYNFYRDSCGNLIPKSSLDKRVSSLYLLFVRALQTNAPLVGYLYGSAFKSAYVYDHFTQSGKVLSRSVDLQERIEYETYGHLRRHLRGLGINFQFVIIRDIFHARSLNLGLSERIHPDAPEIKQYGEDIQRISRDTHVVTVDLHHLLDASGKPLSCFIEDNLSDIRARAETIQMTPAIAGMKGFLSREYAYEPGSNAAKERRAIQRAKRYVAMKDFVREHEGRFLIPSMMREFGANVQLMPFSIHVEDYLKTSTKVPLRTITFFLGGSNAQHQLPLLQQRTDRALRFYTIRSDFMNKLLPKHGAREMRLVDIGSYKTFLYEGDEDIEKLLTTY